MTKNTKMLLGVSGALMVGAWLLMKSNKRVISLERTMNRGPFLNTGGIPAHATTAAFDASMVGATHAAPPF